MRILLPLLAAALLAASPAHAYFEETDAGARAIALGPSGMASVADISAYHWDPANLVSLRRHELLVDYSKPDGVADLAENTVAVGGRYAETGYAFAWHHLGVTDVYGEDQFCVAAARTLRENRAGKLDAGATFKFGRVSFRPFTVVGEGAVDYGAVSRGSLDLGLRWRTPWPVDVAWVLRDVLRPRYQFVAGSGGYRVPALNQIATAVRWNRESTISLGWAQQPVGGAQLSAGLEITFFDVFAVRSGIRDVSKIYAAQQSPNYDILTERPPHDFTFDGGVGVYHKGFYVDAAAQTNHDLGVTYRASVRFPFGGGGAR
jgi:hypothetical protein